MATGPPTKAFFFPIKTIVEEPALPEEVQECVDQDILDEAACKRIYGP